MEGGLPQERQDRKEVHEMHVNDIMDKARTQFQHKFATNQKAANKVINKAHSKSSVIALKDSQGGIVHDPMQIRQMTFEHFAAQATPASPKAGQYKDVDSKTFRWSDSKLDDFRIETKVGWEGYIWINSTS